MRKSAVPFVLSLVLALGFFPACGGGSEEKTEEEKGMFDKLGQAAEDMGKAAKGMKQMAEEFEEMEQREPVPPVHFSKLIEFLPTGAYGLTPQEPEGETTTMGEWKYSQASIRFRGESGESVDVKIFDYAYISMMYAPYKVWHAMGMNKESTRGYERTTEIAGHPGFEKWDKKNKLEEVTALVGKRYVVTVNARGLEEGNARQLIESMSIAKLAALSGEAS